MVHYVGTVITCQVGTRVMRYSLGVFEGRYAIMWNYEPCYGSETTQVLAEESAHFK